MVIQCGFFMVEVFQDLGFIGSGFFRVHGLSGSRFSRVRVFQGPGFPGSRSKVLGLGPDFRSSQIHVI